MAYLTFRRNNGSMAAAPDSAAARVTSGPIPKIRPLSVGGDRRDAKYVSGLATAWALSKPELAACPSDLSIRRGPGLAISGEPAHSLGAHRIIRPFRRHASFTNLTSAIETERNRGYSSRSRNVCDPVAAAEVAGSAAFSGFTTDAAGRPGRGRPQVARCSWFMTRQDVRDRFRAGRDARRSKGERVQVRDSLSEGPGGVKARAA